MTINSYFWSVKVYTCFGNGHLVERLYWGHYTFELFQRWKWYFQYRSALLQVKYPKYYVHTAWGPEPATKSREKILKNRIRAKKAKITEYSNKLKKFEDGYTEIFPISENEMYIKAKQKIERLKSDLIELQSEIESKPKIN